MIRSQVRAQLYKFLVSSFAWIILSFSFLIIDVSWRIFRAFKNSKWLQIVIFFFYHYDICLIKFIPAIFIPINYENLLSLQIIQARIFCNFYVENEI